LPAQPKKKVQKKSKNMGRSWPNQKHQPKGASPHSPESRHWPDSKPVQQWWEASKPAAPYVRCVFRSVIGPSFGKITATGHGIFRMAHYQPSNSAFAMAHYRRDVRGRLPLPHACGTRRIGGHHREKEELRLLRCVPRAAQRTTTTTGTSAARRTSVATDKTRCGHG
jgi:hypothetical protein